MALSTITLLDSTGATKTFVTYVDPAGNLSMVSTVVTTPPTVLASAHTLSVTTTAALLSSITGGIPAGATHALFSVPPGGGNVYFTEDGTTPTVAGMGICIPAGGTFELQNLAAIRVIADAGTIVCYPSFRQY